MRLRQKFNYFLTKDLMISLYQSKAKAICVYINEDEARSDSFELSVRASPLIQPLYYTVKQFNYPMKVTHVVLSWSFWSENEKKKENGTGDTYSNLLWYTHHCTGRIKLRQFHLNSILHEFSWKSLAR